MRTRQPAVAGMFYEADPARLRAQVDACFAANPPAPAAKEHFIGTVVPHAGLMYSGHVAAAVFSILELPKRLIILCPNHTGAGKAAAINREGVWRMPFGEVAVDTPLADALMAESRVLQEDAIAHAREHSLEVQLPFLQRLMPEFTFVPICLGAHRYEYAEDVGAAIAKVVRASSEPIGIVASSDMNHYEDQQTTMRKDQIAIDQVLALDPQELWRVIDEFDVSMCGFIPATTMLIAARALGAKDAKLVKHATSGDVNGDYGHVVGYAGMVVS